MKLIITHPIAETREAILARALNIACLSANGGVIPTSEQQQYPERDGLMWYYDDHNHVQLCGLRNDHWCKVEKFETGIVLQFSYRYDRPGLQWAESITALIQASFPTYELKIEQ